MSSNTYISLFDTSNIKGLDNGISDNKTNPGNCNIMIVDDKKNNKIDISKNNNTDNSKKFILSYEKDKKELFVDMNILYETFTQCVMEMFNLKTCKIIGLSLKMKPTDSIGKYIDKSKKVINLKIIGTTNTMAKN